MGWGGEAQRWEIKQDWTGWEEDWKPDSGVLTFFTGWMEFPKSFEGKFKVMMCIGWSSQHLVHLEFVSRVSVQFSRSVMSDSLWPHVSQHARPPCPSPIPGVYSNSCPSTWWCHPAISSSVIPFSSCPQSLPASRSFIASPLLTWGRQSIGVSASASVLPMNTQDSSPLGWTGWVSLQSKGLSRVLQHHSSKASILRCSAFFTVQLSHPYMTTGKTIALTRRTFRASDIHILLDHVPYQ